MSEKIDFTLLEIICCPICGDGFGVVGGRIDGVGSSGDWDLLVCKGCKKEYRLKEGIPVLLTSWI